MAFTYTRRLQLEGAFNTRDLGGWPTAAGGATKWGAFLRSDGTAHLTTQDIDALLTYGVTDTVDLRSTNECEENPSLLETAPGINGHRVPMLDNIMSGGDIPFPPTLGDLYISMLDHGARDFAKVFRIFARAKGCVLFHCAVGKDRTGMTAMLLLKLAGAYDVDVLADYAASEIYLEELTAPQVAQFEQQGLDPALLKSNVDNMKRGLAHLAATHGTAESFLQAGGLSADDIAAVRKKLLG